MRVINVELVGTSGRVAGPIANQDVGIAGGKVPRLKAKKHIGIPPLIGITGVIPDEGVVGAGGDAVSGPVAKENIMRPQGITGTGIGSDKRIVGTGHVTISRMHSEEGVIGSRVVRPGAFPDKRVI